MFTYPSYALKQRKQLDQLPSNNEPLLAKPLQSFNSQLSLSYAVTTNKSKMAYNNRHSFVADIHVTCKLALALPISSLFQNQMKGSPILSHESEGKEQVGSLLELKITSQA